MVYNHDHARLISVVAGLPMRLISDLVLGSSSKRRTRKKSESGGKGREGMKE